MALNPTHLLETDCNSTRKPANSSTIKKKLSPAHFPPFRSTSDPPESKIMRSKYPNAQKLSLEKACFKFRNELFMQNQSHYVLTGRINFCTVASTDGNDILKHFLSENVKKWSKVVGSGWKILKFVSRISPETGDNIDNHYSQWPFLPVNMKVSLMPKAG